MGAPSSSPCQQRARSPTSPPATRWAVREAYKPALPIRMATRVPIHGICARRKRTGTAGIGASPAPTRGARTATRPSNDWPTARLRVSRRRKDFAAQAARALGTSSEVIADKDVPLATLVKTHHLAKRSSDARWGLFLSWVRTSGGVQGLPVVAVPARFTTQDCRGCGSRVRDMPLQADPCGPALWPGAGPGLECRPHHAHG